MKKINKKQKTILAVFVIVVIIISYGIYFYHSNMYEEFEESENIKELIPYEYEQDNNKTEIASNNTDSTQESGKDTNEDMATDETGEIIVVHITGEVKNWGVLELPKNSRIADAIEKAGGLTEDADVNKINLAFVLEDGMKIRIPSKSESNEYAEDDYISKAGGENTIVSYGNSVNTKKSSIVNINTATQTELETLPGIGTSTALKIINYRNENGKFQAIEDIKNVSRNRG